MIVRFECLFCLSVLAVCLGDLIWLSAEVVRFGLSIVVACFWLSSFYVACFGCLFRLSLLIELFLSPVLVCRFWTSALFFYSFVLVRLSVVFECCF